MGNIEKIRQLLRVVKPEKMRKGSGHEHLESDAVALAKLSMKEDKKRDCSEDSEIGVDGSVDPFYTGVPTFSVRRDYCCEEGPPCGLDPVNMCLIPPKGSPTSRTSLRLGSCPMIVTMSTRCVPAVAIWPLAINGVIARCTISATCRPVIPSIFW